MRFDPVFPCYYEPMNLRHISKSRRWQERFFGTLLTLFVMGSAPFAQADGTAIVLDLDGAIGVATTEYITSGIKEAEARNATLVIIRMDTPGGLVNSMRDIVTAILGSDVPVATYVSPSGARADSAGTYILLASHIAAMAPTTHLGAATPVSLGGDGFGDDDDKDESEESESESESDPDDEEDAPAPGSAMERKVMNDAIAYIRGLAEAHGRNADWEETAVT